jgi:DNA-binding NtrC family response regulator
MAGHGGTLRGTGQPGQGTTFWVELPVGGVPESAPPPSAREDALPPVPSSAMWLVEDEPGMRRALAPLLRRDGHTVETVANGRLALALLPERADALLLRDLRMPELDGPGLYWELAQHAPHLCRRFIVLTGDTLSPEALAFLAESGVPQLTKPCTAVEVRRIIQQALRAG